MFTKIYDFIKRFIKDCYKELIIIFVFALFLFVEFPYVVYTPGGTINLNERITISNEYKSSGDINMTYVSVAKGTLPNIILSKILKNWDLEKSSDITLENDSVKDTFKKDKYYMKQAQDNAALVAYRLTGKELKVSKYHNYIIYIDKKAKTGLKEYDDIISVNNKPVTNLDSLKQIVNSHQEGDVLTIKVLRDKKEVITTAKVYKTTDGLKIGVAPVTNIDYEADPNIKIESKNSESGPSGGAMTCLSIYNKLIKEDITKGKIISGTGTLDETGKIGEIGGVKYKLIGAVKAKSDIFICPKENYEEALKVAKENNYKIKIITGDTIEEVINILKKM